MKYRYTIKLWAKQISQCNIFFSSFAALFKFYYAQYRVGMNTKLIYSTMSQASLYLDQVTIQEIKSFIDTFIGQSSINDPKLSIYLSTSIVCQCKRLPAIQANLSVPFGLTVQRIMKLYPQDSKEQFLTSIINIAQKWPTCPAQFLHKLQNLKFNLRIFNKYRSACKQIGEVCSLNQSSNYLLSSLFWLIYLIAKSLFSESDSLQVITVIVPFLIGQIYIFYLRLGCRQRIQDSIYQYFSAHNPRNQHHGPLLQKYRRQFLKILSESYKKRYLVQLTSFDFLIYRPTILQRLIDDLSNTYAKMLESNPQFSIDQMSFLDIRKDKTPEGFQQKISKDGNLIDLKLSFDKQKAVQQEIENLSLGSQQSVRRKAFEETPLSLRMQNMSWIRNCNQSLDEEKLQRVKTFYQKFNQGKFSEFYQKISNLLQIVIAQFSPTCKDLKKRKKQIYKFFVFVINIAIEMYHEQISKVFSGDHLIISIFCLCTEIFNFVYQTYSGPYSRYCQIFKVDYINAFWPINWFGYFIRLPKAVEDHLYLLQRRFLLKEIWVGDLGYKIITNHEQVVRINELRMLQRLKHHIRCRIDEICRQTTGQKMMGKINNLVLELIERKPHLLKKNNIDQIIICSIAACLSINQNGNKVSLEKIFSYYQKVSLSSIDNKQRLYDDNQNQLNIIDFYNNIFLEEIQDIIQKSPETNNFLLTPKRLEFVEKYKEGISMTPLKQKYKDNQSGFLKKMGEVHQGSTYQLNLARNIKMDSQQAMVDEQEEDHEMRDQKN